MQKKTAVVIATLMLNMAKEVRNQVIGSIPKDIVEKGIFEGFDTWCGISNDWDVNIYSIDGKTLGCNLYPVFVNGATNTLNAIEIFEADIFLDDTQVL